MNTSKCWLVAAMIATFCCGPLAAKNVVTKTYVFGFSASFNDSIVYFTDIQAIDSAWTDSKTKFLLGRDQYAYQLRNHFSDKLQMPHRTCVVIYNREKGKLEKELNKMKALYTGKKAKNRFDVRQLAPSDFRFEAVNLGFDETEADEEQPKKVKKEKKQRPPKDGKGARPGGPGKGPQGGRP